MPKVRWVLLFQQCKNFENRLRFDKVRDSLKVGRFLRHSVDLYIFISVRLYLFICIYVHVYVCMCVCVCVYFRYHVLVK